MVNSHTHSSEPCTATTASGERCRKPARPGLEVCGTHAGAQVGRRTALTDDVIGRIVSVLRAGGYVETAAEVAGVHRRRLSEWMHKGDPAGTDPRDAIYRRFREAVEGTRAQSETRSLALIQRAASEHWQAAAWYLERAFPERWARPSQRPEGESTTPAVAPAVDPFDELAARRYRS
jgi:hypothetical protein